MRRLHHPTAAGDELLGGCFDTPHLALLTCPTTQLAIPPWESGRLSCAGHPHQSINIRRLISAGCVKGAAQDSWQGPEGCGCRRLRTTLPHPPVVLRMSDDVRAFPVVDVVCHTNRQNKLDWSPGFCPLICHLPQAKRTMSHTELRGGRAKGGHDPSPATRHALHWPRQADTG